MRIVLATGIYPPEIGGPATYVRELAKALRAKGAEVSVVAYGMASEGDHSEGVIRVSRSGTFIGRYIRYARALRMIAKDADVIEAFSSVSVGIPLWLAHLRRPKKLLRLGGDFLWERATDAGDERGLREWYGDRPRFVGFMNGLLRTFDTLVFSTEFQEDLYRRVYVNLPPMAVIENVSPSGNPTEHTLHKPARLLYFGRFVALKNLPILIEAMKQITGAHLTLAGSGPVEQTLRKMANDSGLSDRITFMPPRHGEDKATLLQEHDVLVIPSKTDISPNTALEARAAGLPVLLTQETGLSRTLLDGMVVASLSTPEDVVSAVNDLLSKYPAHAARSAQPLPHRDWSILADEHLSLFARLL